MSDLNNSNHLYYGQIGGSDFAASLPIQQIPKSKKTETWKKECLNRLEQIGLYQVYKNIAFRDYYKMVEGRLVYQDFDDTMATTERIAEFRMNEANLPTYIKHFDLIGIIVNKISGQIDDLKEKIIVGSLDEFSQGEFDRQKNTEIRNYTEQYFQLELRRLLVLKGINPEEQEFETEEQKQQYLQYLEEEKSKLIPPHEIEQNMMSFRSIISEWGEHTLESDYLKFGLAELDLEEFVDYLLTGRYFKHFHIGHDFYLPESWSPIETFFSQDVNILYPQDGEYVGRVTFMSGSDLLQRYGNLLPSNFSEKLYGYDIKSSTGETKTIEGALKSGFSERHIVPFRGYYDHDLAYKFQSALGVPMGKEYRINPETGLEEARPSYLDDTYKTHGFIGNRYAQYLRDDITVRTDLLQVTEAYWRSYKRVGLLTIPNPITNEPYQTVVEEDLLKDYIKDNNIKQSKAKSLRQAEEEAELNTLIWFYVPQVWKGKKINGGNSNLIEDYWFDIEELPFQIRGNSNLFDVKLPVAGIITSSIAQKIRPYQIDYNIANNMIRNSMEKHIGAFLMLDFNFLPAQYKGEYGEDTQELITEFTQNIKDIGFGFYDSSPQNTKGMNPNASVIQKHSISFVEDMQYYAAMADRYKALAYEQIGINPGTLGVASEYTTAEGIKQGVKASNDQLERIYRRFNRAKVNESYIHLTVAQYCVKNNKDITVDYLKPDKGRILKRFSDDNFHLRKIDVEPSKDPSQRKKLEEFRMYMLQNNTANNDLLDFAKIFTTESFTTLLEYAGISRDRKESQIQEQRQHEQTLKDKEIQARQIELQQQREFESSENDKKLAAGIREAEIHAVSRAADSNADLTLIKEISKAADSSIKEQQQDRKLELQEKEVDRKKTLDEEQLKLHLKELNLKMEQLKARREEIQTKRFTSIINKN